MYRCLASVDRAVAAGRGVPTRALSIIVMLLLGVTVAVAVQIVGALLVLFLLVTPAAASLRVSSSPLVVPMLSVTFAVTASVGGILLALGSAIPISPYITTISLLIYLACRLIGASRAGGRAGTAPHAVLPVKAS